MAKRESNTIVAVVFAELCDQALYTCRGFCCISNTDTHDGNKWNMAGIMMP